MSPLNSLIGIGPKTVIKLSKLDISSPHDIIYHFPRRYLDFSIISKIQNLKLNDSATIYGKLTKFNNIFTRSHKNIQTATIADSTGNINLIWFNQPYLSKKFIVGKSYSFAGNVTSFQNKLCLISPFSSDSTTGKIVPIYRETSGLNSGWFRRIIQLNLANLNNNIIDYLPSQIIRKYNLIDINSALVQIHQPSDQKNLSRAITRLGLDEMISLEARSIILQNDWQSKKPISQLKTSKSIESNIIKLIKSLPFTLTESQLIAWEEIKKDLLSSIPTNRLLQGDVGSGKTIVIILAAYLAKLNKISSIIIAPTKILASQHLATFQNILNCPIILVDKHTKTIPKGSICISTHSIFFKNTSQKKSFGLVIIDEQHKFGVLQRSTFNKKTKIPHTITMSATPIPRTVNLAIMGNLQLSTINSLPLGRLGVKTFLVPQNRQNDCYQWVKTHIQKTGQQCFIVCPFIDPSETLETVKSAKSIYEELSTQVFPDLRLDILHGKLSNTEKEKLIVKFANREIDILISTPIIEVGIDIPNSTTIIIQSADRFGLAALHQLRGRVGRTSVQSYCYLFSESNSLKSINRLKIIASISDGQKIAEYDLKNRGPGDPFSIIQHGFPEFKLAKMTDFDLISLSQKIIADLQTQKYDLKKLVKNTDFSEISN